MKNLFIGLFLFLTISIMGIAVLMYTQDLVGNTFIGNFTSAAVDLVDQQEYKDNITALGTAYIDDAKFNYDWIFLLSWIIFWVIVFVISIILTKLPMWAFLTFAGFFSMFFLFAYSFVKDLNDWLYTNLIINVFSSSVTYSPILNSFIKNQLSILFITFIVMLVLNQIWGKDSSGTNFSLGG